jgi:hypothetical protein
VLGGDGGIRTLDRALQPYNGLANRRLQPLGHVSARAFRPIGPPDIAPHMPERRPNGKRGCAIPAARWPAILIAVGRKAEDFPASVRVTSMVLRWDRGDETGDRGDSRLVPQQGRVSLSGHFMRLEAGMALGHLRNRRSGKQV